MPELIIKYNSPKTFKILKELSSYLDFIISIPKKDKKQIESNVTINGVTLVRGSNTFDDFNLEEMSEIFSRNNLDAKELRSKWQRTK